MMTIRFGCPDCGRPFFRAISRRYFHEPPATLIRSMGQAVLPKPLAGRV
jgi:hypothetical protein